MSVLGTLGDAVGLFVGGGGLAGAVGTVTGAIVKYKERKLEMSFELKMEPLRQKERAHELKVMQTQIAHDNNMAEHKLIETQERLTGESMLAVIKAEGATSVAAINSGKLSARTIAFKTLFRPLLTMALWGGTLVIWHWTDSPTVERLAAGAVIQGAMASLGVWFGQRIIGNHPNR